MNYETPKEPGLDRANKALASVFELMDDFKLDSESVQILTNISIINPSDKITLQFVFLNVSPTEYYSLYSRILRLKKESAADEFPDDEAETGVPVNLVLTKFNPETKTYRTTITLKLVFFP